MRLFLAVFPVLFAGCAPDLRPDDETGVIEETGGETGVDVGSYGNVTINATDYDSWIYFDLESGLLVSPTTPEDSADWDLGFSRFNVMINGGISGAGGMIVAELVGEDYEALQQAPDGDYITDEVGTEDDGEPEYALGGWYDYDQSTHVLTPADKVYAIRSVEEAYFKLRFDSYYDEAGSPAMVQFTWELIESQ